MTSKHKDFGKQVRSISLLLCLMFSGCFSTHQPAPIVSLSTKTASPENLTEIQGDTYTVKKGDTLFAIAFYSGNDYRKLARLNQISAPYVLRIGQTIQLRQTSSAKYAQTTAKAEQKSNNLALDPVPSQAYGGVNQEIHRKNQNKKSKSSNKPYNSINWGWPASGKSTVATVGNDGSKRGLDIKGEFGSAIKAAASGKVVYAGNALKGYGNLIIIQHNDDFLSAYAHNKAILVSEQTYVEQGQKIATMGNSGASDTMLHFEIRRRGKSVDPLTFLPQK